MKPFQRLSRRALVLLGVAPSVLTAVLIGVGLGWLKSLSQAVALTIITGAALFAMIWGLVLSMAHQRRQDEVEVASGRYAMQHGFTIGTLGIATVLLIPSFRQWVIDSSNSVSLALAGDTDVAPLLAYVAGFMTLTAAQIAGAAVMGSLWWRGKQ